jgi:multidrug efflux pump subunit AcrA (membrane-fusion protein)
MSERARAPRLIYALAALCAGAIAAAIFVIGPASGSQATVTRTATVAQGVVQSTVSGSGTLQPATKVGVNFATSGTLTGLFVSVGDRVHSGELLAEVSPTSAESSLRSAEMTLATDEAANQAAGEGLTPAQVRQDEISAAQSRASVASAQQSLRASKETAKSDEVSSAATVAQDEVALKRTGQSGAVEATSEQDAVNQAISQLSSDEQVLAAAKSQLEEAKSALAAEKGKSTQLSSAESKVSSAESSVKSDESKVKQDGYWITTAHNSQAAAALKSQQSLDGARNAVTNAKLSMAAIKLKDRQSIAQAQTSVTTATESLNATLAANEVKAAPPTKSTVVSAENTVKSAQLTVENARRTLSETKLYALAEGVVASIKGSLGEAVSGTGSASSSETSSSVGSGSATRGSGTSGASGTSSGTGGASGTSSGTGGASGTSSGTSGASSGSRGSATGATGGGSSGGGAGSGSGATSSTGGASSGASNNGGGTFRNVANSSSGAGSSGSSTSTSSESSSTSGSSFIELVDVHAYQVVVPLSESEISNVYVGQIATVTVEALEGRKFAAHVASLPVLSTSNSGVVSYDVTFQLDQVEPKLKPGMNATAEVVVKQAEGINIPTSAISANTVTVVHNGKNERRRVVTGLAGNSSTIILSGLNAGETIALPTTSTSTSRTSTPGRGGGLPGGLGGGLGGGGVGGGGGLFRGGG